MINRCYVFVVVLMLCGMHKAGAATERAHFKILLFGDSVGHLNVSKEIKEDGSEVYVFDSHSKAKILWILHEDVTHYEVVYKGGKLISSKFKEIENGEVKRWTNCSFDGKQYNVDSYKGKWTFTEAPMFSIATLYFSSMQNVKRIFYEAEGDFSEVQHTDNNTWEFKSSDGNRNIYHYVNGKAQNMEFHVSIATVKMIRLN
jgi:uncharacterized protein DUF6134